MASSKVKVIDLRKSYVPVDPRTYPMNMLATGREDYPTQMPDVVAYEGYNFMPTAYGYKSYFGIGNQLNIDALPARCDKLLVLQTETLSNILVAMCEDGIYTKSGSSVGAWTKEASEDLPEEGVHYNWTWALMTEDLYMYRAGSPNVWKMSPDIDYIEGYLPALVGALSVEPKANANGLPAGTYTYSFRARTDTQWSEESAPVQIITGAASFHDVILNLGTAKELVRVYLTTGGNTYYRVIATGTDTVYSFSDISLTVGWLPYDAASEDLTNDVLYAAYSVRAETPNFLNMAGQKGIFKAGQRLGFWDSENSVAWSNLDDYMDFVPSIETLAGSAIFGDVTGTIVIIHSHGEGFVIYATTSVVFIQQRVEATFQWDPVVVLSNSGVAYPNEVAVSTPDTQHFAWTKTGFYKIESGQEEVIVPEFYDYVTQADVPVYLQVLEGRYLFIQPLDADLIYGNVEFTVNEVPPTIITFPVAEQQANIIAGETISGNDFCTTLNSLNNQSDMDAALDAAISGAGGVPAKIVNGQRSYTPIYTAYLSYGFAPEILTWDSTPCGASDFSGNPWHMSPVANTVNELSQGPDNKFVLDDNSWLSGGWTIERFIAVQMAIWAEEESRRSAFLNEVLSRAFFDEKTEDTATDLTAPDNYSFCEVGTYPKEFSEPEFGFNGCSFWLTRYLKQAEEVTNVTVNRVSSGGGGLLEATPTYAWRAWAGVANTSYIYASKAEGQAVIDSVLAADVPPDSDVGPVTSDTVTNYFSKSAKGRDIQVNTDEAHATCPAGYTLQSAGANLGYKCVRNNPYSTTYTRGSYNKGKSVPAIGVDTGYCTLSGYQYLGTDDMLHTVSAGSDCQAPGYIPGGGSGAGGGDVGLGNQAPLDATNGTICSKPFEPVTIPTIQVDPITWPSTTVTIPSGSFLLQDGSADPIYPTKRGAFVYDLHLQKWGKLKLDYSVLFDYSPINGSYNNPISYDRFGMEAGVLGENGLIYLFDTEPEDSYIKYGKIGYFRQGMTRLQEIRFQMKDSKTGSILIEASLNGKEPESLLSKNQSYSNVTQGVIQYNQSAKWFSISISGSYDITNLEFIGNISGRR